MPVFQALSQYFLFAFLLDFSTSLPFAEVNQQQWNKK
jgi:hypothetical protein